MIIDSGVITGSLQVSGSLAVTGSSNLQGNVTISGSLNVDGPISGAITGSITNAVSASYALNASTADSATSASRAISAALADAATTASYAIFASTALSASYAATATSASHAIFALQALGATTASRAITAANADTASYVLNAVSASFADTATSAPFYVLTASYNADSASFASRVNGITSVYATTGSNTFTGTQYISNTTNATTFASTPALYTDGGFRVTKDAFISGGLSIAGNLTVFGTSSVNFITSSTLVGLEFINLNTDLPALRYAGINVGDSGSAAGISSSFWYDSAKDNWLYVYAPADSGQQTSSLAINGPITYNNVGNEQGLLGNYVVKSQLITADNNHHITSSQIFDDGTTVAIAGNLQVTGSLRAANLTGSLNGSNLIDASVANAKLTNSSVTVTAGTGMSGGGTVALGSSVTLTNAGVTSAVAGTGISVSGATGAVTITNSDRGSSQNIFKNVAVSGQSTVVADGNDDTLTFANGTAITITTDAGTDTVTITNAGVTSLIAGTGVSVSGATGAITASIGQAVATSSNVQFNSLGVGTAGSAVAGEIRATADITAFYSSDERLKEDIIPIENPIEKLMAIDGVTFNWKEGFEEIHSHTGADTGVIAQQVEALELPGTVTTRTTGYMAVNYEKLNALFIEGFKAQQREINELKALVNTLLNK